MPDENAGTSVAHYDPNQPPATSGGVIAGVLTMAKDPSIDAAKVETLTRLAIELQDRERRAAFNASKIAAIREMPAIYKRGKSDKHRYAKFEDLHRAVMPILARHGMTIDFRVGSSPKGVTVTPILRHENGHVEEGESMEGPPDTGPGRSAIQAIGSSTSYLKRHSLKATLNIIEDGEDDDGNYGFREDEQKNDRQERLILDAEAHAVARDYADWYKGLTAKDKAWLVRAGVHHRCGGGKALPDQSGSSPIGRDERPVENEPEDAVVEPVDETLPPLDDRPSDPPPAEGKPKPKPQPEPDVTTPEGWTAVYERNCREAETPARLDAIEKAGANALRKLADGHTKLWERADRAMADARERLGNAPADDDMFPGDR